MAEKHIKDGGNGRQGHASGGESLCCGAVDEVRVSDDNRVEYVSPALRSLVVMPPLDAERALRTKRKAGGNQMCG